MPLESRGFRLCFLPPRLLAHRMHFETEYNVCQISLSRSVLFAQRYQSHYHQAGFAHRTRGVGQLYLKILLLFFASVQIMFKSNKPKMISH